jgi:hypothetical protein
MSTRKPAATKAGAKRPAVKKKAAAPAARKAATKVSARRAAADAAPTDNSLVELLSRLGRLELAGLAGRLVQGWRKDLEVVVEVNQKSLAGLQTLVAEQMVRLKAHVGEVKSVAKLVAVLGPKDSVRHIDDLAVASVELALSEVREMAAAAARSQQEAFELVHQRVTANIEEVQRMLRNGQQGDQ